MVQNYEKNPSVELKDVEQKAIVYISSSNNSVFKIPGKVKGVVLDNCASCTLLVDDVLSTVDVVNCEKATVYCQGAVRTLQVGGGMLLGRGRLLRLCSCS